MAPHEEKNDRLRPGFYHGLRPDWFTGKRLREDTLPKASALKEVLGVIAYRGFGTYPTLRGFPSSRSLCTLFLEHTFDASRLSTRSDSRSVAQRTIRL